MVRKKSFIGLIFCFVLVGSMSFVSAQDPYDLGGFDIYPVEAVEKVVSNTIDGETVYTVVLNIGYDDFVIVDSTPGEDDTETLRTWITPSSNKLADVIKFEGLTPAEEEMSRFAVDLVSHNKPVFYLELWDDGFFNSDDSERFEVVGGHMDIYKGEGCALELFESVHGGVSFNMFEDSKEVYFYAEHPLDESPFESYYKDVKKEITISGSGKEIQTFVINSGFEDEFSEDYEPPFPIDGWLYVYPDGAVVGEGLFEYSDRWIEYRGLNEQAVLLKHISELVTSPQSICECSPESCEEDPVTGELSYDESSCTSSSTDCACSTCDNHKNKLLKQLVKVYHKEDLEVDSDVTLASLKLKEEEFSLESPATPSLPFDLHFTFHIEEGDFSGLVGLIEGIISDSGMHYTIKTPDPQGRLQDLRDSDSRFLNLMRGDTSIMAGKFKTVTETTTTTNPSRPGVVHTVTNERRYEIPPEYAHVGNNGGVTHKDYKEEKRILLNENHIITGAYKFSNNEVCQYDALRDLLSRANSLYESYKKQTAKGFRVGDEVYVYKKETKTGWVVDYSTQTVVNGNPNYHLGDGSEVRTEHDVDVLKISHTKDESKRKADVTLRGAELGRVLSFSTAEGAFVKYLSDPDPQRARIIKIKETVFQAVEEAEDENAVLKLKLIYLDKNEDGEADNVVIGDKHLGRYEDTPAVFENRRRKFSDTARELVSDIGSHRSELYMFLSAAPESEKNCKELYKLANSYAGAFKIRGWGYEGYAEFRDEFYGSLFSPGIQQQAAKCDLEEIKQLIGQLYLMELNIRKTYNVHPITRVGRQTPGAVFDPYVHNDWVKKNDYYEWYKIAKAQILAQGIPKLYLKHSEVLIAGIFKENLQNMHGTLNFALILFYDSPSYSKTSESELKMSAYSEKELVQIISHAAVTEARQAVITEAYASIKQIEADPRSIIDPEVFEKTANTHPFELEDLNILSPLRVLDDLKYKEELVEIEKELREDLFRLLVLQEMMKRGYASDLRDAFNKVEEATKLRSQAQKAFEQSEEFKRCYEVVDEGTGAIHCWTDRVGSLIPEDADPLLKQDFWKYAPYLWLKYVPEHKRQDVINFLEVIKYSFDETSEIDFVYENTKFKGPVYVWRSHLEQGPSGWTEFRSQPSIKKGLLLVSNSNLRKKEKRYDLFYDTVKSYEDAGDYNTALLFSKQLMDDAVLGENSGVYDKAEEIYLRHSIGEGFFGLTPLQWKAIYWNIGESLTNPATWIVWGTVAKVGSSAMRAYIQIGKASKCVAVARISTIAGKLINIPSRLRVVVTSRLGFFGKKAVGTVFQVSEEVTEELAAVIHPSLEFLMMSINGPDPFDLNIEASARVFSSRREHLGRVFGDAGNMKTLDNGYLLFEPVEGYDTCVGGEVYYPVSYEGFINTAELEEKGTVALEDHGNIVKFVPDAEDGNALVFIKGLFQKNNLNLERLKSANGEWVDVKNGEIIEIDNRIGATDPEQSESALETLSKQGIFGRAGAEWWFASPEAHKQKIRDLMKFLGNRLDPAGNRVIHPDDVEVLENNGVFFDHILVGGEDHMDTQTRIFFLKMARRALGGEGFDLLETENLQYQPSAPGVYKATFPRESVDGSGISFDGCTVAIFGPNVPAIVTGSRYRPRRIYEADRTRFTELDFLFPYVPTESNSMFVSSADCSQSVTAHAPESTMTRISSNIAFNYFKDFLSNVDAEGIDYGNVGLAGAGVGEGISYWSQSSEPGGDLAYVPGPYNLVNKFTVSNTLVLLNTKTGEYLFAFPDARAKADFKAKRLSILNPENRLDGSILLENLVDYSSITSDDTEWTLDEPSHERLSEDLGATTLSYRLMIFGVLQTTSGDFAAVRTFETFLGYEETRALFSHPSFLSVFKQDFSYLLSPNAIVNYQVKIGNFEVSGGNSIQKMMKNLDEEIERTQGTDIVMEEIVIDEEDLNLEVVETYFGDAHPPFDLERAVPDWEHLRRKQLIHILAHYPGTEQWIDMRDRRIGGAEYVKAKELLLRSMETETPKSYCTDEDARTLYDGVRSLLIGDAAGEEIFSREYDWIIYDLRNLGNIPGIQVYGKRWDARGHGYVKHANYADVVVTIRNRQTGALHEAFITMPGERLSRGGRYGQAQIRTIYPVYDPEQFPNTGKFEYVEDVERVFDGLVDTYIERFKEHRRRTGGS